MTLRRTTLKDIPHIRKMIAEGFEISQQHADSFYPPTKLAKLISDGYALTSTDGGSVVGVILGCPDREMPLVMWIDLIVVDKSCHRKGIGTTLLRAFEKKLRSDEFWQLLLHVETINPEAIRFYEKNGFVCAGELDFLPPFRRVFYKKILNKAEVRKQTAKWKKIACP
jgi:ribosomal protein S18 acetylase RimI-like enzyme